MMPFPHWVALLVDIIKRTLTALRHKITVVLTFNFKGFKYMNHLEKYFLSRRGNMIR